MELDNILKKVAAVALSKESFVKCITGSIDTISGDTYKIMPTRLLDLDQGYILLKDHAGDLYHYAARNFRGIT